MGSIEYEVELTDEERAVQETVHRFAEEVMRPAGAELDAMADPQDVIAEGSILWEVFEKHRALGLDQFTGSRWRPDAQTAGAAALHHQRRAGLGGLGAGDRLRSRRLSSDDGRRCPGSPS